VIAGADIRQVQMTPDVDFFAELEHTIRMSFPKPKMLILNFPANPTAQCVELPFFEKIIALAKEHGIYVVHDLAYADICFDGWKAPSIMQVEGRCPPDSGAARHACADGRASNAYCSDVPTVGQPSLVACGCASDDSGLPHIGDDRRTAVVRLVSPQSPVPRTVP
jgi:hypothetical protein